MAKDLDGKKSIRKVEKEKASIRLNEDNIEGDESSDLNFLLKSIGQTKEVKHTSLKQTLPKEKLKEEHRQQLILKVSHTIISRKYLRLQICTYIHYRYCILYLTLCSKILKPTVN